MKRRSTGAFLVREYIWLDGRPLAIVEAGQTYWIHWDRIQRPVMATDATGAVIWAVRYLPFGSIDTVFADTLALEQNLRFPGQWFQVETGLYQNGMRDYDPTTGRYLEADPLGLIDGPSIYGYVRQNPGRWVDPIGEWTAALYIEGDYIVFGGGGLSSGLYLNFDHECGLATWGSFSTDKTAYGIDFQPANAGISVTGGAVDDFRGDSTSAEVDVLMGTIEVGETDSLQPSAAFEISPPLLPAGGSVAFSKTNV